MGYRRLSVLPSMFNTSFSLNLLSGSVGIFLFRNICIVKLIENLPNSFQISYCYFFFPPEKHYFSSAFKMLSLVVTCWVRWSPRWAWQCQPRRATGTAGRADFLGHLASTPPPIHLHRYLGNPCSLLLWQNTT